MRYKVAKERSLIPKTGAKLYYRSMCYCHYGAPNAVFDGSAGTVVVLLLLVGYTRGVVS